MFMFEILAHELSRAPKLLTYSPCYEDYNCKYIEIIG
jgi:hypothetical protein